MITTSYFKNIRNVNNPISISRFPPNWYNGECFIELAPTKELLFDKKQGKINNEEYTIRYHNETLSQLNPQEIYDKLDGYTLLCYEEKGKFCHRHLVKNWLEYELGVEINEL